MASHKLTIAANNAAHGEQPAVGGDDAQEVCGDAADPGFGQNGADRLELLVDAEDRAAHQPVEIGASDDHGVELLEVFLDLIDSFLLERELEECAGISAGHSGNELVFARHLHARFRCYFTGRTPSRSGRRKLLESKEEFRFCGRSRVAPETLGKSRR